MHNMENKNDSHNLLEISPTKAMDPMGNVERKLKKCACRHNSLLKKYKFEFITISG